MATPGDDERTHRRPRRRDDGGEPEGAGKVAFVLSGGGNLGALQVGMLKALLGHGIVPDLIVGCSVGAINGAGLADDPTMGGVEHMERVWTALEGQNLLPSGWLPNAVSLARKGEAVHDQAGLRAMAEEQLRSTRFDQLAVPFQCVATDIMGVREVWFSEGPIVDAILASSALPAIYPAVEVGGVRYLDGGIVDDVPMSRAVELGATTIYVLQVGGFTRPRPEPQRPLDVAVQAYWIARHHRFKRELASMPESIEVHVLPAGETPKMRFNDFTQAGTLIDVAHAATDRYLDDRAAGLPIPPMDEALASVEPGYEGTAPVATNPGPAEGRWRRLTASRHRAADTNGTAPALDTADPTAGPADHDVPVGAPDDAAVAAEGHDHRRVAEMRQALRGRVARSRQRRDAAAVALDVASWRRAVTAHRPVLDDRPATPAPGAPSANGAAPPVAAPVAAAATGSPGTVPPRPSAGNDTAPAPADATDTAAPGTPGARGAGAAPSGNGTARSAAGGTGTRTRGATAGATAESTDDTPAGGTTGPGDGTTGAAGRTSGGRTTAGPTAAGRASGGRNGAGRTSGGRTAAGRGSGGGNGSGGASHHAGAGHGTNSSSNGNGNGVGARVARLLNRGDES